MNFQSLNIFLFLKLKLNQGIIQGRRMAQSGWLVPIRVDHGFGLLDFMRSGWTRSDCTLSLSDLILAI
jgi:hypothetical protein